MEACGTSPIGRVDSQTIMAMKTASKYIILVLTMDGMTILAFVDVNSSAAGEFVQVVCTLVVLEEKYFHNNYITANPTTDVSVSTTTPNNTDEDKGPGAGKGCLHLILSS